MKAALRKCHRATGRSLLLIISVAATASMAYGQVPPQPTNFEALPTSNTALPITCNWDPTPTATSYVINRSTTSGAETRYATATTNQFVDSNVVAGPPTIYYYTVVAVNASGSSIPSVESGAPTPLPTSPGNGSTAGTPVAGGTQYYCEYALLDGFDWFGRLNGWFPETLGSSAAIAPGGRVVDMAYATLGTLTFFNVNVPSAGWYNIDFRYAYSGGLFGGINDRMMGLAINGVAVATTMRFPITGNFETYQDSILQEQLKAGTNTVQMFAVTDYGISRVDALTVTAASGPGPSQPLNVTATPGNTTITLAWSPSTNATAYNIYRGGRVDGEAVAPIATVNAPTTTYTNTGLTNGTTYYYNVAAISSVGISPNSVGISAAPSSGGPPPAPTGVAASAGTNQITISWNASAGATSYNLFRSTTAGGEGTTAYKTGVANPFTDTGLTNGTTYYYKVNAVNAAGSSAQSAEVNGTPTAPTAPPTPTGLTAAPGNTIITVSWNASSGATSYNLFRSTTAGGEGTTPYKTGVTSPFSDTGLTNGTKYYYKVDAVNNVGTSAQSAEASATPTPNAAVTINCGGAASGSWVADTDFTGGGTVTWTHAVDTSLLTGTIPPQAVLQTDREGGFTYTIPSFAANSAHSVTVYFVENYWTAAGKRVFSVTANGTTVIANLDVFATAGAQFKAIQKTFNVNANASGQIVLGFTATADQAKCGGISVQ